MHPEIKNRNKLSINTLLKYLLTKWKWYVVSILLCLLLSFLMYSISTYAYYSSAKVMIKEPEVGSMMRNMDIYDLNSSKVNISNEIQRLNSRTIIRKVVQRLNLTTEYEVKKGLRTVPLYNQSPISVFSNNISADKPISFSLTISDDSTYDISDHDNANILDLSNIKVRINQNFSKKWANVPIRVRIIPEQIVIDQLLNFLAIRQESNMASTLNISILDSSPSRAADIINTLIDIYTEQAIIDKNRVNDRSSDFINSRIEIIERELGLVEDEIENYKRKNLRLTDDNSNSKYISKNNNYEDEILRYDTQLKIIEFLKDEISDAASSREVIPNLNSVGIQELNLLVDKYNALKIKRDRLIEDSSKNSPIVLETDKAMDGIIESITVALDNAASILNTRRDDALSHHINTQSILAATPSFERQLQNINRQHKIKESLYLFLLNKREDNEISKALVESNIQVLDAAEVPRSPISPNLPKMIAAALMCGVLLPTLCFVMGIFLDTKVHNIKDMDGLISVPYLGNTPKVKHGISSKSTPAIHDVGSAEDFVLAESCRILRTNIDFHSRLHGDAKVIMITSIDDGAGKTFLAQNLAASMGCGGATVLVDLDIRSLSLTNSMCANAQGITDYLINNSLEPHSIVQHLPQFDIVPAGKQIPNISEWLASERLDSLFAYLRSAYRHVIVDCASVGFVADTSIVNRLADITICVIRSGRFDRSELPTLERLFQSGRLKNMAIVINGTKIPSKYRDLHESFYI